MKSKDVAGSKPSARQATADDAGTPRRTPAAERPLDAHDHDLVTTAAGLTRLSVFVGLVRAAGLNELLQGDGPFTVFAPTDRAFGRIPARELDALVADAPRLADVLRHHVVAGRVKAPRPDKARVASPIEGDDLTLTSGADTYFVNDARLVRTNIRATNGVIHAIDRLLGPLATSA